MKLSLDGNTLNGIELRAKSTGVLFGSDIRNNAYGAYVSDESYLGINKDADAVGDEWPFYTDTPIESASRTVPNNGATDTTPHVGEDGVGADRDAAFLFTVDVPQGVTIKRAILAYYIDQLNNLEGTEQYIFNGEDTGNAAALNGRDITQNPTTASTTKTVPAALGREFADVTSIVQEIVNRGDWNSGQDMNIFAQEVDFAVGESIRIDTGEDGYPMTLTIEYETGSENSDLAVFNGNSSMDVAVTDRSTAKVINPIFGPQLEDGQFVDVRNRSQGFLIGGRCPSNNDGATGPIKNIRDSGMISIGLEDPASGTYQFETGAVNKLNDPSALGLSILIRYVPGSVVYQL